MLRIIILLFSFFYSCDSIALPRVVALQSIQYKSLRYQTVNMRVGPGMIYPITWILKRVGWPVRVIERYGHWIKIIDCDNDSGWIIESLTENRPTVVTIRNTVLRSQKGMILAYVAQGYVFDVLTCNRYCFVKTKNFTGFVPKQDVWGAVNIQYIQNH